MKFISRTPIPENAEDIKFNFEYDKKFGMINLCNWEDNIKRIENPIKVVIKNKNIIYIHYPVFKFWYVMPFIVTGGVEKNITFIQLIKSIIKTGNEVNKHIISDIPNTQMNREYAITTNSIKIYNNNVYVELQH